MRVRGSLVLGMAVLLAVAPLTAWAATSEIPSVATSNKWDVRRVPTGYRVTLRLDKPVPVRAAMPLLAVNGKPVGVARQSADGRTLTLVTSDQTAASAHDIQLVWPGEVRSKSAHALAGGSTDAYWLKARKGPLLQDDPGKSGKYKVETSEYNLGDEAVYLPGLHEKSEVLGKVYAPVGALGRRPLVIFLHGRHEYCYGGESNPEKLWPCSNGTKPLPSYRGYDGPARALASNGYQVVSISANAVNAYDGIIPDQGAQARAELVLHHLALWKKWSTTGGEPFGRKFVGKVDLQNVGLMGHSRGGEGVARAAVLNADRGGQYGIRAVLPLAPTDFARANVPGVAMSVVLPYCDGDVSDLEGQKFYDDSRYSMTGDTAPRSTVTVLGANHNFFNTEWTPGQSQADVSIDDWYGDPGDTPCGTKYAGRLTPKEQQAVGTAYVAGFFRLQLGREKQFLPLLDGSDSRAASAGKAVTRVVSQAPLASRRDLNRLDQALPAGAVTGKASAIVCAGVAVTASRAATPVCMSAEDPGVAPHWVKGFLAPNTPTTAVTKLSWTGTSGVLRLTVPAVQRDVRRFAALSFRAAPDPAGTAKTDLSVRVVDGRGKAVSVPVSTVSDALVRMPGSKDGLAKNLLRTVRIPVASLQGIDLRNVRAVELRTDLVAKGSAYVSDVAFSSPGIGRSVPARLPKLSIGDFKVKEGDRGTKIVDVPVTLSRPSIRRVTVYAESYDVGDIGDNVGVLARKLVFAPGQVRQSLAIPIPGGTRDSADRVLQLVVSAPQEALLDRSFGAGSVLDDDPSPKLVLGDVTTTEKNGEVTFPVRLSAPSDLDVGFDGVLKDGTAVFRKDYTSVYDDPAGPADRRIAGTVEAGKVVGDLSVRILDDKVKEATETFTVVIADVNGAELAVPQTRTATILDND